MPVLSEVGQNLPEWGRYTERRGLRINDSHMDKRPAKRGIDKDYPFKTFLASVSLTYVLFILPNTNLEIVSTKCPRHNLEDTMCTSWKPQAAIAHTQVQFSVYS